MRLPAPPPPHGPDAAAWDGDLKAFVRALSAVPRSGVRRHRYLHWDDLRFRQPPPGLSTEQWWAATRFRRVGAARPLDLLRDHRGSPFSYVLADEVLAGVDRINQRASGHISLPDEVTNPATRDRFIVSSLIEESITSSQLEGAATTRQVAKDMIRSGRDPRDRSERMILNNYRTMERIRELRDQPVSPVLVLEIHRMVSEGTLDNPDAAGRLQTKADDRVSVFHYGEVLHSPPPASELQDRLQRLCAFANGEDGEAYLPPVLRAIAVHFMMGFDHYFEDGNGRTARALFYWVMLREGYWLTEYLTISKLLKKAPTKYARSFLLTETDGGDLTHFFIYHLAILNRAIDGLHEYLATKAAELDRLRTTIASRHHEFNHRQLALLEHALRDPHASYTVHSHALSHHVSGETARKDLMGLADDGLLNRVRRGKHFAWSPVPDLAPRLES